MNFFSLIPNFVSVQEIIRFCNHPTDATTSAKIVVWHFDCTTFVVGQQRPGPSKGKIIEAATLQKRLVDLRSEELCRFDSDFDFSRRETHPEDNRSLKKEFLRHFSTSFGFQDQETATINQKRYFPLEILSAYCFPFEKVSLAKLCIGYCGSGHLHSIALDEEKIFTSCHKTYCVKSKESLGLDCQNCVPNNGLIAVLGGEVI